MFTRISKTLAVSAALLTLTACGTKIETDAERAQREKADLARAEAEGRIPCAIGGAKDFATNCTIERERTQDGLILTVRHADALSALMDLSDNDLLDVHLARKTLLQVDAALDRADVHEVLKMLREPL